MNTAANTAVISADAAGGSATQHSEGVWAAAWRRFQADRVGLVSLIIVALFILLIVLAGLGLVAKSWQTEVGVPNAPPTFMGPAPPQAAGVIEAPKGPNVDLSDLDPLAPSYTEWDERAKQFQTTETVKAQTLPFGGDRLGRGYFNGQLAGDRALAGTVELQLNFLMTNDLAQPNEPIPVQLYTFYDTGTVRNLSPNDVASNRLHSFGIGTRIDFSSQVTGELEVTRRLKLDVDGANVKDLPEDSIYARLVLRY